MCRASLSLLTVCLLLIAIPCYAQTSAKYPVAPKSRAPQAAVVDSNSTAISEGEADDVARMNMWTIGLVGGLFEGATIRFANDIKTVLDDGTDMRVLTIVGQGVKQNVLDLLYLKGVDVAITHSDVFDQLKKEGKINNIDKRVQYISQLHVASLHLLVRPEIKSLKDLEGKRVGFQGRSTGPGTTAPIVFERLGIKVDPVYDNNTITLEKMKTGEVAGLVYLLSKKHASIAGIDSKFGFHLLPIEFDKFMDYYVPATIEHDDYPNVIAAGERIETIGVPAVLAVYNWPAGTDRRRRAERFIKYYFEHFERFKDKPFQAEWKEINLGAKVPGWMRYSVADEMLAKLKSTKSSNDTASSSISDDPQYKEFLEWRKTHYPN
jgi:TRAP-type uncharacterized transport system substrate-binding protein